MLKLGVPVTIIDSKSQFYNLTGTIQDYTLDEDGEYQYLVFIPYTANAENRHSFWFKEKELQYPLSQSSTNKENNDYSSIKLDNYIYSEAFAKVAFLLDVNTPLELLQKIYNQDLINAVIEDLQERNQ